MPARSEDRQACSLVLPARVWRDTRAGGGGPSGLEPGNRSGIFFAQCERRIDVIKQFMGKMA